MKTSKIVLYIMVVLIGFTSCKKNFLDRGIGGATLPEEKVFSSEVLTQQYADNAYLYMVNDYMRFDDHRGSSAQASDEAVSGRNETSVRTLAKGTYHEHALSGAQNDITDVYSRSYTGIRYCNTVLSKMSVVPWVTNGLSNRIEGEMHFLRAYFYFELIKRFGGVVLLNKAYAENEDIDLPRNTYQECIDFIMQDLDQARNLLPPGYPVGQTGRATLGAALALRARVLLYAASPLNNPNSDLNKWQEAAQAAKDVIDLNSYSLQSTYEDILNVATSPEYILVKPRGPRALANWIDGIISPGYGGSVGQLNPTQNHVDLYEMKATGRLIGDPLSGYNSQDPYTGRDPRLAANVLYNGLSWQGRALETWQSVPAANGTITYGRDYIANNLSYTVTRYYCRKMWPQTMDARVTNTTGILNYVYFRYAEVLLNYAEAINEAADNSANRNLALQAVNQIRNRASVLMPALQSANSLAAGYVENTQAAVRARIRNERAVELAFEDHRWYDIMRWDIGQQVIDASNNPMYAMKIVKSGSVYTYSKELLPEVHQKVYLSYMHRYPIPKTEINKSKGVLKQNEGW